MSWDTDLRFDSTGPRTSRWLESEVLRKPWMGQDAGYLSIHIHHRISLWHTHLTSFNIQWIYRRYLKDGPVLQDLLTLNVYWQSNWKLSSTPVMLPLYMTWQALLLPLATLNRRYVAETNLKSPELPEKVGEDKIRWNSTICTDMFATVIELPEPKVMITKVKWKSS